jgi:hypothetical protein
MSLVIQDSYATGVVKSSDGQGGGFACGVYNPEDVANAYWDTTTSKTTDGICGENIAEIVGLTTQQLQSGLPSGFDPSIWAEDASINNGLPYLIDNPPKKK